MKRIYCLYLAAILAFNLLIVPYAKSEGIHRLEPQIASCIGVRQTEYIPIFKSHCYDERDAALGIGCVDKLLMRYRSWSFVEKHLKTLLRKFYFSRQGHEYIPRISAWVSFRNQRADANRDMARCGPSNIQKSNGDFEPLIFRELRLVNGGDTYDGALVQINPHAIRDEITQAGNRQHKGKFFSWRPIRPYAALLVRMLCFLAAIFCLAVFVKARGFLAIGGLIGGFILLVFAIVPWWFP